MVDSTKRKKELNNATDVMCDDVFFGGFVVGGRGVGQDGYDGRRPVVPAKTWTMERV